MADFEVVSCWTCITYNTQDSIFHFFFDYHAVPVVLWMSPRGVIEGSIVNMRDRAKIEDDSETYENKKT